MKYTITINDKTEGQAGSTANDDHQAVDTFMNGLQVLLKQQWSDARLDKEETQE